MGPASIPVHPCANNQYPIPWQLDDNDNDNDEDEDEDGESMKEGGMQIVGEFSSRVTPESPHF